MVIPLPTDWTQLPLHVAAMSFNLQEVERLLSQGADVNENVPHVGTPLHWVIRQGPYPGFSRNLVQLLLDCGADVHLLRYGGGTPLHESAWKGDCDIAEMLLTAGADINRKDNHQRTPLHCAVYNWNSAMVDLLIAKGADVEAVADAEFAPETAAFLPCCGMTPLHVAIKRGYTEIARVLLAAGASLDTRVGANQERLEGFTAYELARHFREKAEREHQQFLRESEDLLKLLKGGSTDPGGLSAQGDDR